MQQHLSQLLRVLQVTALPGRRRLVVAGLLWALATVLLASKPGNGGLGASDFVSTNGQALPYGMGEGPDPVQFSPAELQELEKRFGVHGSQPRVAQLFSTGIDQLQPLRSSTLNRIEELQPLIRRESNRQRINPMLVAAVLFDEMRHAKPGEDLPIAAHSGLFSTHGPAQLGLGELVHQGLLKPDASAVEISKARDRLLDPEQNVKLLIGKFARLSRAMAFPTHRILQASDNPKGAKALATLAYLHNGKLDYPRRILRAMQDPELHAVIYGLRQTPASPLI